MSEREPYADRLLSIASRFFVDRRYKTGSSVLAQEFGVSMRTIQRDMITLSLHLPLIYEDGYWKMMASERC